MREINSQSLKGLADSKRSLENAAEIELAGQSPGGLFRHSDNGLRGFSDRSL
jgi:hypothetical protein